jgi:hypothetical protein
LGSSRLLKKLQKHPMTAAGLRAVRNRMRRLRPIEFEESGFGMHVRT